MTTKSTSDVKPVTIASKQAVVDNLLKEMGGDKKDKKESLSKEKRELSHDNLPELMR